MNIAIIPARIGSKRIKNKNIKLFFSKPIIYWTIKILKKSKLFKSIIVTSNSKKILNYSKKHGCNILIKRPQNLSNDKATTHAAIKHTLKNFNLKIKNNTKIFCVYPCNPLLQIGDLKKSLSILKKNQNKYIFPVIKSFNQDSNLIFLNKSKKVRLVKKYNKILIKQNFYYDAGQFYVAYFKTWKKFKNIHENGACMEIPDWRVVDINYPTDWKKAEVIFRHMKNVSR